MWKEHCFCNEYTCLLTVLVIGSCVWFLYPFVLVMMSITMWNRLLVKCDWLLILESKKQISFWCAYYVYKAQNKLVQPPPPLQITLEKKKIRKRSVLSISCMSILRRPKSLKRQRSKKMSEVTDIPSLIRKYSIIKRQESNWPLSRLYSHWPMT